MTINFNHTIVASRDKKESAEFLAELFGLPSPKPFGRFVVVALEHGVNLDFADAPEGEKIPRQHYAFLVSEQEFDTIYGKIQSRGMQHWADPGRNRPGEINHNDGGRGVYFPDPSGHGMEILTRPYGSRG
jgi:catechol 2,3-dioxygenase-like lactoylglutathione lyase family enzyme